MLLRVLGRLNDSFGRDQSCLRRLTKILTILKKQKKLFSSFSIIAKLNYVVVYISFLKPKGSSVPL